MEVGTFTKKLIPLMQLLVKTNINRDTTYVRISYEDREYLENRDKQERGNGSLQQT